MWMNRGTQSVRTYVHVVSVHQMSLYTVHTVHCSPELTLGQISMYVWLSDHGTICVKSHDPVLE